ncbi:TetR/AcrR family transcriptional regulator [Actinomyces haliotis]|uniref:TetR/AcrR family transcriptional regulator n=1 Tax=Actinomyces haliotis TaxID=1280843 RepID=UPI00188E54A3|nr:TetR family transcriptional regulator [Actinomyces haliotis]
MRSSKKALIVDTALSVVADDGVDALTFESVAERAGLTRGGVVYHFPTREALVEGMAEHLLAGWKAELLDALGKPAEDASPAERVVALVRSGIEGTVRPGELAFLLSGLHAATRVNQAWDEFCAEWVGPREALSPGQRVALLAADGYWSRLATGSIAHDPVEADAVDLMLRLARGETAE